MKKMRGFSILLFALFQLQAIYAQTPEMEWAFNLGGSGSEFCRSLATDNGGNIYAAGYYQNTVDFDQGPGAMIMTSFGGFDIFLHKSDSDGNFVWAIGTGGSGSDYCYDMALDASGNIYLTGYFAGISDFQPGTGTVLLTSDSGSSDVFLLKLDKNGNCLWAKRTGGSGFDAASEIAVDGSGNIIVTGLFENTVDFDPGSGSFYLTSNGGQDIFVQKLNPAGNFLWAFSLGDDKYDAGKSLVVDGQDNIYCAGVFQQTVDFNPGAGTLLLSAAGSTDNFIMKIDHNGHFLWAKTFGGSSSESINAVELGASGNLFLTGYFGIVADFDTGPNTQNLYSSNDSPDAFILKLDNSGNYVWAKGFGGPVADYGLSLAIDANENVYLLGLFTETGDFDPGPGEYLMTSAGHADAFIVRLTSLGDLSWARGIGEQAGNDYGESLLSDPAGNLVLAGVFSNTMDVDPSSEVFEIESAGGEYDIFITRWRQVPDAVSALPFPTPVTVFPNPTSGRFSLDLGAVYSGVEVEITTLAGEVVQRQSYPFAKTMQVEIRSKAGIYLTIIRDNQGRKAIFKIIKL